MVRPTPERCIASGLSSFVHIAVYRVFFFFNRYELIKSQNTFDKHLISDFCLIFGMWCPYLCLAFQVFVKVHVYLVLFRVHSFSTVTVSPECPYSAWLWFLFPEHSEKTDTGEGSGVPI